MPEFILNRYDSLNEFARGYVEAMFFTNGDCGDERENLLNDLGTERLTRASIKAIKRDCDAFLSRIMPDGCFVRQWVNRLTESDASPRYGDGVCDDRRAGHMFWYARQGHGVAWTDDYAPIDDVGYGTAEELQKACRSFGESYVEVCRGWIHVR